MIDEDVKRFFETYNSTKIRTLPEMTPEVLEDLLKISPRSSYSHSFIIEGCISFEQSVGGSPS